MKSINLEEISKMDKLYRINLINSITGIKPANLIGTKSIEGEMNLAIISSVVHLGSNPPLIGFVMRPSKEVRRDTFDNIMETSCYTINAVGIDFLAKAHYTSAKFESHVSEFEQCQLTPLFDDDFEAPFVGESALKFAMKTVEVLEISNGTKFIIGKVQKILVDPKGLATDGQIDLEKLDIAGVSGLNAYYALKKSSSFPYARPNKLPSWD